MDVMDFDVFHIWEAVTTQNKTVKGVFFVCLKCRKTVDFPPELYTDKNKCDHTSKTEVGNSG